MDCTCPNCRDKAELTKIGKQEFIECLKCGWFETQADGSMSACDSPQSETRNKALSASSTEAPKPEGGNQPGDLPPPSPPPSEPVISEDEEDDIKIRINFED